MLNPKKPTITVTHIVRRAAKILGENFITIDRAMEGILIALIEYMKEADPEMRIEIRDFGVFDVKKTKAKPKARNPRTGEIIYVPARRKVHFKAGKILKAFLKESLE